MKKKEKLKILFEDKYLVAVYKKCGIPTIKSDNYKDNLYSQVYDYLHKKNQKVFIVHRLDADTSGIVVFAKNENVKNNLQLNWNNILREYVCVVHGRTNKNGVIESYLKETRTLYTYSSNDNSGKYAKTKYITLEQNKNYSLVKVILETGRKNQIRVHMKDNNTPIVGDRKYGIKDGYRNMMLESNRILLLHPITKKTIDIILDIPLLFLKIFEKD